MKKFEKHWFRVRLRFGFNPEQCNCSAVLIQPCCYHVVAVQFAW